VERVCRYIRAGAFIESAALGCGITRQTFYLWMRTGNAARDDRLAHSQRGVGVLMLTPDEERCVEFLDAMEEALSEAENRWVCGIVEAGTRDWRAWAWRADRRTRLPHGYRACGEWDLGATESTLSGIRERQAARVAWQKKMSARVAAEAAAAAAARDAETRPFDAHSTGSGQAGCALAPFDAAQGRQGSFAEPQEEVIANPPSPKATARQEPRKSGNAEDSRIQNSESRRPNRTSNPPSPKAMARSPRRRLLARGPKSEVRRQKRLRKTRRGQTIARSQRSEGSGLRN
jgi:hypothetical protein